MPINYGKRTIAVFKGIFSTDKYKFEPKLKGSVMYQEINAHFKIGENKARKFLKRYEIIEENGDVSYKNPSIWHIHSNLPFYFDKGVRQPTSIDYNEELQTECGRTLEEVSKSIETKYHKYVPPKVIGSWAEKNYAGKIKKGPDGIYYVSSG